MIDKKCPLPFKQRRETNYKKRSLERDAILFKWKSETVKLPFNPEFWLTTNGSIGYLIKEKMWVLGTFNGLLDEYGDFTTYVWHSMNTNNVKTGEAKNHEEIIVCGNTPLYRAFEDERRFYAEMKAEADASILSQLILSRLNKAIIAANDQQKKQIEKAYKELILGNPLILTTNVMDGLDTLDLTDNDDIQKMQYLSTFYQSIQKREANDFGIDLDVIDKRAQVNNEEIKQFDDVTTLEYLVMYEMRQRFVEEMKENGFEMDIVRNPIFYDEPKPEDIDEGTFEAAEASEEPKAEEPEKGDKDNDTDNQTA